jgi:hypothetical protein
VSSLIAAALTFLPGLTIHYQVEGIFFEWTHCQNRLGLKPTIILPTPAAIGDTSRVRLTCKLAGRLSRLSGEYPLAINYSISARFDSGYLRKKVAHVFSPGAIASVWRTQ